MSWSESRHDGGPGSPPAAPSCGRRAHSPCCDPDRPERDDFLTRSAVERAHEVLAEQRDFTLDDATKDQFVAVLDEPVRPDPRLVELFSRPQRIAR